MRRKREKKKTTTTKMMRLNDSGVFLCDRRTERREEETKE